MRNKKREFTITTLIALLGVILGASSFVFSIYVYYKFTGPATESGFIDSRLTYVESQLQSANQILPYAQPSDGNITRLKNMVDQAQKLDYDARDNWTAFNLAEAQNETLQAEDIMHAFHKEVQPTPSSGAASGGMAGIGAIIGPIIAVIVIALGLYWFLRGRKPKTPSPPPD